MSFLRNHMRHFVLPGIRTLAKADGKTVKDTQIKPWAPRLRPSSKCRHYEAGLLLAAVSSILRKGDSTLEVAERLCRTVGQPGYVDAVYELDSQNRVRDLGKHYEGVEGADVLHSFVLNSARSLKRLLKHPDAMAVYPGRDVWCWEVISRKVGLKTVYDPRVSRALIGAPELLERIYEGWGVADPRRMLVFDSGYAGSVPRAVGRAAKVGDVWMVMLSAKNKQEQIFPGHTGSRAKALACEYLAKYRTRAVVKNGEVVQYLADLEEFIKAALLSVWLWYHVSPRRLPSWGVHPRAKRGRPANVVAAGPNTIHIIGPPDWQNISVPAHLSSGLVLPPGFLPSSTHFGGSGTTTSTTGAASVLAGTNSAFSSFSSFSTSGGL